MKNIFLIAALLVNTVIIAQVGIGTQNPQGIFNIDGAKNNATSGAPTASQQVDDFVVTSAGRVGIGTTSPANKLQVNGNALFAPTTTNDGISGSPITVEIYGKLPTGTATQVGGIKMGWFSSFGGIEVLRGASVLGMGLGFNIASEATGTTSEAMRITSDGNVGIGTTAPSQKLDVSGNVKFSGALMPNNSAGTTGQILTSAGSGVTPTWTTLTTANTPNIYSADGTLAGNRIVTQGANNLTFSSTTGNLIFNPSSSGKVGIGTASPTVPLEVQNTAVGPYIPVVKFLAPNNTGAGNATQMNFGPVSTQGNAAEWRFVYQGNNAANNRVDFGMNGVIAPMITYLNSGNVGINTTAPSQKLDVLGTGLFRNGNDATVFLKDQLLFSYSNSTDYRHAIKTRHHSNGLAGNAIDFYTWKQGTDAATTVGTQHVMTLDGNGNVGVGTTIPISKLHVNSNLAATNTINANASMLRLSRPTTPSAKWDNIAQFNMGSYEISGATTFEARTRMDLALNDGATTSTNNVMTWQGNGNVGIGTTAPISKLDVNGTVGTAVRTSSVSTTTSNDFTVLMTTSGTSVTLEAPTNVSRRIMAIKNTSSGTVSVVGNIDGNSSSTFILLSKEAIEIQSDGTTWQIIAKYASPVPLAVSTQLNPVSIPSGVNTLLTSYTNVSDASNGAWNASTGVFTCNKAGLYRFEIRVMFSINNWTQGNEVNAQFLKNGVAANSASWFAASTYNQYAFSGHNILTLNLAVGDTIQARIWHNGPGARTTYNAEFSNFSIAEIR